MSNHKLQVELLVSISAWSSLLEFKMYAFLGSENEQLSNIFISEKFLLELRESESLSYSSEREQLKIKVYPINRIQSF